MLPWVMRRLGEVGALSTAAGRVDDLGVVLMRGSPSSGKAVALLLDPATGAPLFVAKFARHALAAERLRREWSILELLDGGPAQTLPFRVPRPVLLTERESVTVTVQEACPGTPRTPARGSRRVTRELTDQGQVVLQIAAGLSRIRRLAAAPSDPLGSGDLASLPAYGSGVRELIADACSRLRALDGSPGLSHGDLWGINLLVDDPIGRLGRVPVVIDWEFADWRPVPATDITYFALKTVVYVTRAASAASLAGLGMRLAVAAGPSRWARDVLRRGYAPFGVDPALYRCLLVAGLASTAATFVPSDPAGRGATLPSAAMSLALLGFWADRHGRPALAQLAEALARPREGPAATGKATVCDATGERCRWAP